MNGLEHFQTYRDTCIKKILTVHAGHYDCAFLHLKLEGKGLILHIFKVTKSI